MAFWPWAQSDECFSFQLLIPEITPVSRSKSELGFEILTQKGTPEDDNLHIYSVLQMDLALWFVFLWTCQMSRVFWNIPLSLIDPPSIGLHQHPRESLRAADAVHAIGDDRLASEGASHSRRSDARTNIEDQDERPLWNQWRNQPWTGFVRENGSRWGWQEIVVAQVGSIE